MGKFTLEIELGNDAMQTADDIAHALKKVAMRLTDVGDQNGRITDYNGNTVGKWELRETDGDD